MKKNVTPISWERVAFVMLFFASFFSVAWSLSKDNLPVFDDYILLNMARFTEYQDLFHILPSMSYNDRPLRMILLKVLNDICGQNFQSYHIVLIGIHLINVYLAYKVCELLFAKNENSKYYAIIAAAVIGIYPYSHMTVVWVANTPDMQCATFILLAIFCYLKRENVVPKVSIYYGVGSVVFLYLALRCKEMALTLPIMILMYEIYKAIKEKRRLRINIYFLCQVVVMLVFLIILFGSKGATLTSTDSVYYQSFSPKDMLFNAIKYLFLFFDWGNSAFYFGEFSKSALPGVVLFACSLIYGIYLIIKKREWEIVFAIIEIGISLGIVLPLVNSVHRTYLYIPSFFVGVWLAVFLMRVLGKTDVIKIISLIIVLGLYLICYTSGNRVLKEFWFEYCRNEEEQAKQIRVIEKPENGAKIFIKGASDDYNIFTYGPGESIKYIFENDTYKIELVDEFPEKYESKDVFILYEAGKICVVDHK